MIREAGGFIADCDGAADPMVTGNILAANAELLPQMQAALKEAGKA